MKLQIEYNGHKYTLAETESEELGFAFLDEGGKVSEELQGYLYQMVMRYAAMRATEPYVPDSYVLGAKKMAEEIGAKVLAFKDVEDEENAVY